MDKLESRINRNFKTLMVSIFVISAILRIPLSLVNYQANDEHLPVIQYIKNYGILPDREDCWECFQPKLYYSTAAATLKLFSVESPNNQIIVSQLINCIAGLLTLFFVFSLINSFSLNNKTKLITFSLIAFNPKLIGINSQATNDSFVILFSTSSVYFAYEFFQSLKLKCFFYMTTSTIFATLSKGNGLVIFIGILITFLMKYLSSKNTHIRTKKEFIAYLVTLVLAFMVFVPTLGQYWTKYSKYGSPFVINVNSLPKPFPHFFKKSYIGRPGVISIFDAYFTFRLFDMIEHPITQKYDTYSASRTSLWSQLYGKTHFIFFDNHPKSWGTKNKIILNIGRIILVLALLPTAIFLVGVIKRLLFWIFSISKGNFEFLSKTNNWIFDIIIYGYLSFIVVYTLMYRDFTTMKVIFIYPALLPGAVIFSGELDSIYNLLRGKKEIIKLIDLTFVLLFSLYLVTVLSLIYKLWRNQF